MHRGRRCRRPAREPHVLVGIEVTTSNALHAIRVLQYCHRCKDPASASSHLKRDGRDAMDGEFVWHRLDGFGVCMRRDRGLDVTAADEELMGSTMTSENKAEFMEAAIAAKAMAMPMLTPAPNVTSGCRRKLLRAGSKATYSGPTSIIYGARSCSLSICRGRRVE